MSDSGGEHGYMFLSRSICVGNGFNNGETDSFKVYVVKQESVLSYAGPFKDNQCTDTLKIIANYVFV
eukprot:3993795-Amphidinium_carterae.1